MMLLSRPRVIVERKYVFTRFSAEKDLSLTAFVAGITRSISASLTTCGINVFWALFNPCKNLMISWMLSLFLSVAICGRRFNCRINSSLSKSLVQVSSTASRTVSNGSPFMASIKRSCKFR